MAYAFGDPKVVPRSATRRVPCVPAETALLVIDVQYYCSLPLRGCHATVPRGEKEYFFGRLDHTVLPNIGRLLLAARATGIERVFTVIEALTQDGRDVSLDYKLSGPLFVPKGHPDAAVLQEVAPVGDEIVIPKTSCSVFCSTNIHYVLRNLGTRFLLVCGQMTNQCVESAVRDAADLGYLVTLVEDACAANSAADQAAALSVIRGFARIARTEEIVAEVFRLAGPSRTPGALPRQVCVLKACDDEVYGRRVPSMTRELLAAGGAHNFNLVAFDAFAGSYPKPGDLDAFAGLMLVGSPSTVAVGAPQEPWVAPLCAFVRDLHKAGRPFAGIGFGHQLAIAALGGTVVVNPAGLQTSKKVYAPTEEGRLALELPESTEAVGLLYHHCDAAVALPLGARSWGYGASGHWGMTLEETFLTTQGHPEFSLETGRLAFGEIVAHEQAHGPYSVTALGRPSAAQTEEALASLASETDHLALARAFAGLFELREDGEGGLGQRLKRKRLTPVR